MVVPQLRSLIRLIEYSDDDDAATDGKSMGTAHWADMGRMKLLEHCSMSRHCRASCDA